MTDREVLDFLESTKRWDQGAQDLLIIEWNTRRQDLSKIGRNSVRTPCRLRSVVGSFKLFLLKKIADGQPAINV